MEKLRASEVDDVEALTDHPWGFLKGTATKVMEQMERITLACK